MGNTTHTVDALVAGCSVVAMKGPKYFRASHGLTRLRLLARPYLFCCSHFVAPCVLVLFMLASHGSGAIDAVLNAASNINVSTS